MVYVEGLKKGELVEGKNLGKFARIFNVEKDKVSEGLSKSFVATRLVAVACFRLLVLEPHPMKPGFAFVKSNRSLEDVVRIRFHNSNPTVVSIFVKPKHAEVADGAVESEEKLVAKTYRFKNPSQFIRVLQYACAVFNKRKKAAETSEAASQDTAKEEHERSAGEKSSDAKTSDHGLEQGDNKTAKPESDAA